MARTKISEFSATPGDNTDIDGINLAEGCAPSGINNAIREMMSQLKDFQAGTQGDSFNGPVNGTVGATTPNTGAFTTLSSTGNTTLGNDAGDVITVNGATTFVNSNPILNAGTANGVAYLNGSKALTTGTALTFDGTRLTATYAANYVARFGFDSSYYMDAGYYGFNVVAPANPFQAFFLNSSEQMRLTSTGLGIGTSSPKVKLQTVGEAAGLPTLGTSSGGFLISSSNGLYGVYGGVNGSTGDGWFQAMRNDSATAYNLILQPSGGNLGLGVTPSAWDATLKVFENNAGALAGYSAGGVKATVLYTNVFSSGGDKYKSSTKASKFEYDTDSGSFKWYTAPSGTAGNAISFTQAMTLNASGNLGVGTTSPGDYRLHVSKGAAGNIAQLTDGVANTFIIRSASNTLLIGEANNNPLAFVTNNTERARIDSSGNLLVGQTAGTAKVAITQAGAAQDTIAINIGSGGAGVAVVGSAAAMTSLYMQTSSGYAGAITNSGTTTTYATASDHRLKTDIQPMTGALAFVRKQRPVTYRWKADGSEGSGYIAHWMQEDGAGQCVTGNKDAVDADGKAVYQGIDTSFMVGPLNAALNELADIVDAQAAIIEQLKARLDAANL